MNPCKVDWKLVLGPLATQDCGFDSTALKTLEEAVFGFAPRAVRMRPGLPIDELPFASEQVPWFPRGRFLCDHTVRPGGFLHHAAGDYYVQDAGSMLALEMCEVVPGQFVCDTCAAPGGKTTGLLELMDGRGVLVSNEVIGSRLAILKLAMQRTGYANHLLMNMELERLGDLCGSSFDCVLVDAPCTGQSMVARGKQSMAAFSATQIGHSSARQKRIVRSAATLVKPGGRMVYSTCAFSYAENEKIITEFLDEEAGWESIRFDHLTQWESPVCSGCYRLWPHRDGCAGAFAAALIKTEDQCASPDRPHARQRHSSRWEQVDELPAEMDWLPSVNTVGALGVFFQHKEELHRFPEDVKSEWIEQSRAGTPIARNRSGRWDPLFASAKLQGDFLNGRGLCIELDDQQASRFVAGESIRVDSNEKGWCIVTWRGRRLSWGKLTQRVLKNHFPKPIRQAAMIKCP